MNQSSDNRQTKLANRQIRRSWCLGENRQIIVRRKTRIVRLSANSNRVALLNEPHLASLESSDNLPINDQNLPISNRQIIIKGTARIIRRLKTKQPIFSQTAGIYYPTARTGRLANPLPICYRHRRICYRSSQPATESIGNLPISNQPITDRPACGIDRFAEPATTTVAATTTIITTTPPIIIIGMSSNSSGGSSTSGMKEHQI